MLVGAVTPPRKVTVRNTGDQTLRIDSMNIDSPAGDFLLDSSGAFEVAAGTEVQVAVRFKANTIGSHAAHVTIDNNSPVTSKATITLTGIGEAQYRINTGGGAYVDSQGKTWTSDATYVYTGNAYDAGNIAISDTVDDKLYQSERWSPSAQFPMVYEFPVVPGTYLVRLHFAEVYSGTQAVGARVFDVHAEGVNVLDNYDIFASVGGFRADVEEIGVTVQDGALELAFHHVKNNPKISAIEIYPAATGPVVTAQPSALDFGNVRLGHPASERTTTIVPGDGKAHTISGITLNGSHAAFFAIVNAPAFPFALASNGALPITVQFAPNDVGVHSAQLQIAFDDPGNTITVPIAASVLDPLVTATPNPIAFGNLQVGMSSAPVTLTVVNGDTYPHMLHHVELVGANGGDYTLSGLPAIPVTLQPQGSTSFSITFAPTTVGTRVGEVKLHFDTHDFHVYVDLTGNGIVVNSNPDLSASPASLNFGNVVVGQSGNATLQIQNAGNATLNVSSVTVAGPQAIEFTQNTALPLTIAPGGQASLEFSFLAGGTGSRTAVASIASNDPDGPVTVPLAGNGVANQGGGGTSVFRVNAGGPAYTDTDGNVWAADTGFYNSGSAYAVTSPIAGTTSDALYQSERWSSPWEPMMTYTFPVNPGTYTVEIHLAEIFSGAQNPGQRVFDILAEGAPIYTGVDIASEAGYLTALVKATSVNVQDSALNVAFRHGVQNPKVSGIAVYGTGGSAKLVLSRTTVDFAPMLVQQPAVPQDVLLINAGSASLNVNAMAFSGLAAADYSVAPQTPLTIAPNTSRAISIGFTPTDIGARPAILTVTSNGSAQPVEIVLTGTGLENGQADVSVSPVSHTFGNVTLGQSSSAKGITLTNSGSIAATIESAHLHGSHPGDFTHTGTFPLTLPAGETAAVNTVFSPTSAGARTADLEFHIAGQSQTLAVALSGTGTVANAFTVTPGSLAFGNVEVGTSSTAQLIQVQNISGSPATVNSVSLVAGATSSFQVTPSPSVPATIAPGSAVTLSVKCAPSALGNVGATLRVTCNGGQQVVDVPLSGTGIQPPPAAQVLFRVNAGGSNYTDPNGNVWVADTGYFNTGSSYSTTAAIAGTTMDPLYQTERWDGPTGQEMQYNFTVSPGTYAVTLHFAEIYSGVAFQGGRVFDVLAEGNVVLNDFDIFAKAGFETATTETFTVAATDGQLNIQFVHGTENPKVSAIEVKTSPVVSIAPSDIQWGHVAVNTTGTLQQITLTNSGQVAAQISTLRFTDATGDPAAFSIVSGANRYTGTGTHAPNVSVSPGGTATFYAEFTPPAEGEFAITAHFEGNFASQAVQLHGDGGASAHPFLHVVINVDPFTVDYDQNGVADVYLEGSFSHTHELGKSLTGFAWKKGGTTLASTANATVPFAVGSHTVSLTIQDNNVPPQSLTDSATFLVASPDNVPGAIAKYFDGSTISPESLLNNVPAIPDFAEFVSRLAIHNNQGLVGGSLFTGNVMVQLLGKLNIAQAGTYTLAATGGSNRVLFINNAPVTGPLSLTVGQYTIDARFAVPSVSTLPLRVTYALNGGTPVEIADAMLTHDETAMTPVLFDITPGGHSAGGNVVTIQGIGFVPPDDVTVQWGGSTIPSASLTVTPNSVTFMSPPGTGTVNVSVVTPAGTSNALPFAYTTQGDIPVVFNVGTAVPTSSSPTQGAWGPDGRLYVGGLYGVINAYTFDDNYNVTNTQSINTLAQLPESYILGIAFNPTDAPGPVRIYVAHSLLFANGGACFDGFSPYSGKVSVLTGPNFNTVNTVISGLPVSNHDHGINGMAFDNNGDLLICVGGNTNAGVAACPMGGLDESPLAAAIIKAEISRPDFNGQIHYTGSVPQGESPDDQVYGGTVTIATNPPVHIDVFAPGLRNAFDLVYTTGERVFATDNGPNQGYGAASTGPNTQNQNGYHDDELNFIRWGDYYGHPNRNRGRVDARQYVYYGDLAASPNDPGVFHQSYFIVPPSTNGVDEYRANTFNGAMRGDLVMQQWNGNTYRVEMNADGKSVDALSQLPSLTSLDVLTGPGGVIIGLDHSGSKVSILKPVDAGASGVTVYDVFPWRSIASGGTSFVIGGVNFGNAANTTVTFGGLPAQVTSVSSTRIKGVIPASAFPTSDLVDITVTSGGQTDILPKAFRYLSPQPVDNGASVYFAVAPTIPGIHASTYSPHSFSLVNTSTDGQQLQKIRIDLGTAIFRDNVFDPYGLAGDPVGKPFTLDYSTNLQVTGVNYVRENKGGYEALELSFNGFDPGEEITFSIDIDPTSIHGAAQPGPGESGSVAGIELIGAEVTAAFSDATVLTGHTYHIAGTDESCDVTVRQGAPQRPVLNALHTADVNANVTGANQTIRVKGAVGAAVKLIVVEGALYLEGVPNGGYEIEPFEANTAIYFQEFTGTIGANGFADIPVPLSSSVAQGGYNHVTAVVTDAQGRVSRPAEPLILYLP
ncbi:MAG: hypothetical protein AMXMBFR84_37350 [Candidatus Hydrogenedentota bacterium]